MDKYPRHALACLLLLSLIPPAFAGPWPAKPGEAKLLVSHLGESAQDRPFAAGRTRNAASVDTDFSKLHLEYGLTSKLTFEAVAEHVVQEKGHVTDRQDHIKMGLILNAPKLETGLLPPYFYRGLKKLMPAQKISREKRAGLRASALARHTEFDTKRDDNHGYETELALADKISIGRFTLLQNIETGKTRMEKVDWRRSLYRLELGWGHRLTLGKETYFFDDRSSRSNFAALTHLETLSWHWPERNIRLKLSHGDKRQTGFVKADVAALEFEIRF